MKDRSYSTSTAQTLGAIRRQSTHTKKKMFDFELKRLGMLMEPEPENPHEVGGVLNPAPNAIVPLVPKLSEVSV